MNGRLTQIGFSQRIRLEWLETTANLILAGNDKTTINNSLQRILEDKVSVGGRSIRGNREKSITILLKTWVTVPPELGKLREAGLDLLRGLTRKDRIAVHWAMAMASYPFWGAVAALTGRLFAASRCGCGSPGSTTDKRGVRRTGNRISCCTACVTFVHRLGRLKGDE